MVSYLYRRILRELRKIRYRAVGSAVLIIISVSIFVAVSGMIPTTQRAMEAKVKALNLHDLLVHVVEANESEISELSALTQLTAVDARIAISSRMNIKYQNSNSDLTALLYGIDSHDMPKVDTLELFTPDSSYFTENASNSILIERNFAANRGIGVGDEVSINTVMGPAKLKVTGIVMRAHAILVEPFWLLNAFIDEVPQD